MSLRNRLEAAFPKLKTGNWEPHSKSDPSYNCLAFAAGDVTQRWEPDYAKQFYWPPEADRENTVLAAIEAYQTRDFVRCEDASLEEGFEKIAIYATPAGGLRHATRQLPDGRWVSKLGYAEDIIHNEVDGVACDCYGQPVCFMKRPRQV